MSESISKRSSLPSLNMNKFFVSKRASMFEVCEETPREKRDRSPCGALEVSERKLIARKDEKKKAALTARKKRQADPYAEESTELEEEDNFDIETKICGHANRAVNINLVKKYLKQSVSIGECVHCTKAKVFSEIPPDPNHRPVIWLCTFCGYQGCDRNSPGKHSYLHYKTPRSDAHCIVINIQFWTVWCYDCDSEIVPTSSKKLHEVLQYVKRLSEMAPKRNFMSQLAVSKPTTNLTSQYSGSDSRLYTRRSFEDITKAVKFQKQKQYQVNAMASIPKVKGISNLGNTCFFNSVIQNLGQTHFLTQLMDVQLQSGQRVSLPGYQLDEYKKLCFDNSNSEEDESEQIELKPLELFLPEGGSLSIAFCVFMKDLHSVCKNGIANPSHLFGQICKKSTQFQGYQQQDAHELLRCLLDAIRNEEILRIKKAILKAFALNEKIDPNSVNAKLRKLIKEYGKQATHTIIDQIFGGQLISTVFCEDCHWSSQVFEPFMDLSLPINEEKGKPKKCASTEDDSYFDCFGRTQNGFSSTGGSGGVSKHQQKKTRKEEKQRNRRNRKKSNSGQFGSTCIRITTDDNEESSRRNDRKARRLTEKRRPEEEEEYRQKEEQEKHARDERAKEVTAGAKRKGESSKFLELSQKRNSSRQKQDHSSIEEESGTEEKEYDDDYNDILGLRKKVELRHEKGNSNAGGGAHFYLEGTEEEEEDDDDEGDEEETEANETGSNVSSNKPNSRARRSPRETSDADVEDNTDSEYMRNSYCNTRHPSIVVDESTTDPLGDSEPVGMDSRYLRTGSYDHLNYSSDCSERYFTAAGPDTMDELDNINADTVSLRSDQTYSTNTTTTTSGKGDSISISSGDTLPGIYDENRNAPKLVVEPVCMDDICLKVGELKIRRKSSCRESILDTMKSNKRGSTETLHTFNSNEKINDDSSILKKSIAIKKLKQEWIARSLTTLATRYICGRQECSVMSCLTNFTAPELMTGNNKIVCENCTKLRNVCSQDDGESVKSNASKQLLILSPPAVLTLHLKRFHHVNYNLTKVNRYVHFPLLLDIAPFTSSISLGLGNMSKGQTQVLYGLYGVVEHSGRLNSGHYVAYVRSRPLDTTRTTKEMLNMKPWSQFEINHLVAELAEQKEAERTTLNSGLRVNQPTFQPLDIEELEEEIRGGRWFHVSDTYVAEVNVEKVLKSQAYILFYERML